MMMKTAREEKAFGVNKESGEFTALPVTFVLFQYILHNVPDLEIPFAILIPSNVPAEFRGLSQMVGICLLTRSQTIPSGNLETHYLYVSELVNQCYHDVKIRDIQDFFIFL